MALTHSTEKNLGLKAPEFNLIGVDEKTYSLNSFSDARALMVVFMCNHCPYVVAVRERINELAKQCLEKGSMLVGINSNDAVKYPKDSYEAMQENAKAYGYVFPYLYDDTQQVAKSYDAVCTPDPFLFENVNGEFLLRYQGRVDDNWKEPAMVTRNDLSLALDAVLEQKKLGFEVVPSMGCNIKWKAD